MCGITGILNYSNHSVDRVTLDKMIVNLKHRGPDEKGYYIDKYMSMAQSRLSIIDISGGKQPISNEDDSIRVIFNGEIFNYIEIREILIKNGHTFKTKSDTEVIVHAYEEYGLDFVKYFIGQFAIALWDSKKKELILH